MKIFSTTSPLPTTETTCGENSRIRTSAEGRGEKDPYRAQRRQALRCDREPSRTARNPRPYQGKEAVADTATEVRRLRNLNVSVLGVFAGEEKGPGHREKNFLEKIFAYIRDIRNFSKIVGRYLTKQLKRRDDRIS